ncbi:MAG: methylmalonyl-CoA epimerase [Spirochaetales bacterium]|jgi:methylmalonyl-CoA/ethylmalonyl-CoA epimerase|nr:methylmalonyl-CoA epimerase [Spirochaetales bacterium]|tara:strand:- start:1619 stop:2041 length:423 start_codon:yes stop_codon:yes gene_type:complete
MDIFKVGNLYHIGIAVYDATKTAELYKNTLGLKIAHEETSIDQGVRAIMLLPDNTESCAIELLEATIEDSSISKFLENRGEGIHHVCYLVDNIYLAIKRLEDMGIEMIDHEPREGINKTIVAFAHPKSMNNVLIELAQKV